MSIDEARAAVGVAIDKWHRTQGGLYEGQFVAVRAANADITAALDALIAVVEQETKAAMPCYLINNGQRCARQYREMCKPCTARAEKENT